LKKRRYGTGSQQLDMARTVPFRIRVEDGVFATSRRIDDMTMSSKAVDVFRRLEESLWRDDPASSDQMLSNEFQEFCRFGDVYDRAHLINAPASEVSVTFPFDDFRAESLSDDVVLVTYENTVTNNGAAQRARQSSIWVRSSNGWKLRFQQATTLTQ